MVRRTILAVLLALPVAAAGPPPDHHSHPAPKPEHRTPPHHTEPVRHAAPAHPARKPVEHKPVERKAPPPHRAPRHPAAAPRRPAVVAPPPSAPPTAAPAPAPAPAAPAATPAAPDPAKGTSTGLPLPRFASLKTDDVNLRTGPGLRYPIQWVYKRRDLPVEIEREFEVWRLIADSDGVKGWVHQATLVGRRTFVVVGAEQTIRNAARDDASAVARLKPGVVGRIRNCAANAPWCQVQVGEYRGWLKREAFWGTYPTEAIQ